MSDYIIHGDTLKGIADAVRGVTHDNDLMTPQQIKNKIEQIQLGYDWNINAVTNSRIDANGRWIRPQGYPNLDLIEIDEDSSELYLTYDLNKTPGISWISVYVDTAVSNGKYKVERGHLENNVFVADESHEQNKATYFRQDLDENDGLVQLWRVISNDNITLFGFASHNASGSSTNYHNQLQPCVEKVGRLDWISNISSSNAGTSTSARTWGTFWLERESVKNKGNRALSAINSAWVNCYSLVQIDEIGNWNFSNATMTSFGSIWHNCFSLRKLDLSKWDVSGLAITNIGSAWNSCYSLQELDVSTWDTSNWAVTNMASTWNCCCSLKELDISGWDTSKWGITSLSSTWYFCSSLKVLDLSDWETDNWAVTTLYYTWRECNNLQKLDVSTWDTSNWAVTTMSNTWNACYSLQRLDLSNWEVDNWPIVNLEATWGSCYNLEEIKNGDWDVSDWRPTTLSSTWGYCYSLKSFEAADWDVSDWEITKINSMCYGLKSLTELDLSKWDVSNWVVTDMSYAFYYNVALKHINISNWDVSNWKVTNMSSAFAQCWSLEEINLSNWGTSGWDVTALSYAFGYNRGLKKINISGWSKSGFANLAASTATNIFRDNPMLEELYAPADLLEKSTNTSIVPTASIILRNFNGLKIPVNQNYNNCNMLTRQSILNIIDALPTVSSSKTLTLGQTNALKMTSAELAVATQKGWTVA